MYSNLLRAQKSMQYFTVSLFLPLFTPGFFTPLSWLPFHQSHMVLPALIQEVSAMALGGFRLITRFDSTSRPGWSAIINARHPDFTGVSAITDTFAASALGSKEGAASALVLMFSTRGANRAARVAVRRR